MCIVVHQQRDLLPMCRLLCIKLPICGCSDKQLCEQQDWGSIHASFCTAKDCSILQVSDHFNAEVVAGTIGSKQDAVDYMTWTFLYRRLLQNPAYYDLEGTAAEDVNEYLSALVERTFTTLQA